MIFYSLNILGMKKFKNPETIRKVARVLLIVGWLNRWLMGLFDFDVVALIFGYGFFGRLVYILVGIATVYLVLNPEKKNIHTPLRK